MLVAVNPDILILPLSNVPFPEIELPLPNWNLYLGIPSSCWEISLHIQTAWMLKTLAFKVLLWKPSEKANVGVVNHDLAGSCHAESCPLLPTDFASRPSNIGCWIGNV